MRKTTINEDIFGDHITNKLEGAGNVAHWNKMMAQTAGPTGTVKPTHGLVTDRAGKSPKVSAASRASKAPLDSLASVPVHGSPGMTAATLAQRAQAKARKKPTQ